MVIFVVAAGASAGAEIDDEKEGDHHSVDRRSPGYEGNLASEEGAMKLSCNAS